MWNLDNYKISLKNVLVSVIIPVYKVEKFLDECMASALNQSYKNLEMMDDGSQDNSRKMCDAYAAKDKRIIVIHKPNAGLSSARNVEIINATGKYWLFVRKQRYSSSFFKDISCFHYEDVEVKNYLTHIIRKGIFRYLFPKYSLKANYVGYSLLFGHRWQLGVSLT